MQLLKFIVTTTYFSGFSMFENNVFVIRVNPVKKSGGIK